jgi:lysophospholipase L1-like esterase
MNRSRRHALIAAAAGALLGAGVLAGCGRKPIKGRAVAAGSTVLAFGDSLTHGTGAQPEASYPAELERLTGWKVVNAGVPGDTTDSAAPRLPGLLQDHRPALVLLGLGGNDFLRRLDERRTRENLRQMLEAIRTAEAQALLIAVPRPSLGAAVLGSLSDHPLYGELAEEMRLPLHRQGWSDVLADERLRSDAIHANAEGYAQFARGLVATARAVGYL